MEKKEKLLVTAKDLIIEYYLAGKWSNTDIIIL